MHKVKIKICGIRTEEDLQIINQEQPDYVGFVFAESKRKITPGKAALLRKMLAPEIQAVGVFVNHDAEQVAAIADLCDLDVIQLHGEESMDDIRRIRGMLEKTITENNIHSASYSKKSIETNSTKNDAFALYLSEQNPANRKTKVPEIWKSQAIRDAKDLESARLYDPDVRILLDTFSEKERGGTGKTFDWAQAGRFYQQRDFVLAGGLNAANIKEAINIMRPLVVDLSSGAETDGCKDRQKIKEFIRSVREMKPSSYFDQFGGQFVPESLMNPLKELEEAFLQYAEDQEFTKEYRYYLEEYVGRPSPLFFAKNLTEHFGGAKIYLKREDLNHTGAHKINNVIGQMLLAKKMGKKKVIAETGAGMHGVATATGAALFNMECVVYMGEEDIKRQQINVFKMKLLGAQVVPVSSGSKTLKDATNEAIRSWVAQAEDTFYVIGSVVGPHPYPRMVRDFQKVIGEEVKEQIIKKEGRHPDAIVACVGGGSNAMGIFYPYVDLPETELIGVEAAGLGTDTNQHASAFAKGRIGVLHGMKTYLLQDDDGQILEAHSVSAGLDYPGTGPEHAFLHSTGRARYTAITDTEAIEAFYLLSKLEGIIPALESSHAIAQAGKMAQAMAKEKIIVVNLSGRGDKDIHTVADGEREGERS